MICPYKHFEPWWEFLEDFYVPVLRLDQELSYLYRHRHYIEPSHFQTCLVLLGCFKEKNFVKTIFNDPLGFWRPKNDSYFVDVRFPTKDLLFKQGLSVSRRLKLKEEVYQTGKDLEKSLTDKLKEFEKTFSADNVSERI